MTQNRKSGDLKYHRLTPGSRGDVSNAIFTVLQTNRLLLQLITPEMPAVKLNEGKHERQEKKAPLRRA
jgi:hypothetical protein